MIGIVCDLVALFNEIMTMLLILMAMTIIGMIVGAVAVYAVATVYKKIKTLIVKENRNGKN